MNPMRAVVMMLVVVASTGCGPECDPSQGGVLCTGGSGAGSGGNGGGGTGGSGAGNQNGNQSRGAWHINYALVSASGTVRYDDVEESKGSCSANSSMRFSVALNPGAVGKSGGIVQWLTTNPLNPTAYQGLASMSAALDLSAFEVTGEKVCNGGMPQTCQAPLPLTSALVLNRIDTATMSFRPSFTEDQLSSTVTMEMMPVLVPGSCLGALAVNAPPVTIDDITLGQLLADDDIAITLKKTVPAAQTSDKGTVTAGRITYDLTLVVKKTDTNRK